MTDNPLADFVELPEEYRAELEYSALLCGAIRGALEAVNMDVTARMAKDMLRGDDSYEIRLELRAHRAEEYPFRDDD